MTGCDLVEQTVHGAHFSSGTERKKRELEEVVLLELSAGCYRYTHSECSKGVVLMPNERVAVIPEVSVSVEIS